MTGVAPSILITDDDAGFRDTLCELFAPLGFDTVTAPDGAEAIKIVRHRTVHIVLLDMHMPRMTGLETLRVVKRTWSVVPCILMSADADDALVEAAKAAEAFSVLSKPVSRQTITRTVRRALETAYGWPTRPISEPPAPPSDIESR